MVSTPNSIRIVAKKGTDRTHETGAWDGCTLAEAANVSLDQPQTTKTFDATATAKGDGGEEGSMLQCHSVFRQYATALVCLLVSEANARRQHYQYEPEANRRGSSGFHSSAIQTHSTHRPYQVEEPSKRVMTGSWVGRRCFGVPIMPNHH
eukprot:3837488-Amphidinium_carterae.1